MDHAMLLPSLAEDDDTVAALLWGLDPIALQSLPPHLLAVITLLANTMWFRIVCQHSRSFPDRIVMCRALPPIKDVSTTSWQDAIPAAGANCSNSTVCGEMSIYFQ